MLKKVTVFAILIALVLASFPTLGVSASGVVDTKLEKKWEQLVTNFNNQNFNHLRVHKLIDNWYKTHKNAPTSDKTEIQKHLAICNTAIESAMVMVANHSGFDRDGKVIDRDLARQSVKDLAYYLQQHAGSARNLKGHIQ